MFSNNTQVGYGAQNVLRENPSHHYIISTSMSRSYKAGWIHVYMLFTLNSDCTIPVSQQKLSLGRPGKTFIIFYCPTLVTLFEWYP